MADPRAPKDIHARRAYHLKRAERFSDSANMALGRLWREIGQLREAYTVESPHRLDELLRVVSEEWRNGVSKIWNAIHVPIEFRSLQITASAISPQKSRRKAKGAKRRA